MPRKPEFDREDLINRARDLFWSQGWAGTSLKDLEKVLQMKPGSFYAAFGSKDALYELALERYARDGLSRLYAMAEELGPLEALKTFPRVVVEAAQAPARACMLSKTVLELQPKGHRLAEIANSRLKRMEEAFADLLRSAQSEGKIAPQYQVEVLARRYQSDLLGLRVTAERDGVDARAIASEIAEGLEQLSC